MAGRISTQMAQCAGRACIESQAKEAIARFVRGMQNPDGGFRGRGGPTSDLYYTVFGAATLRALGRKLPLLKIRRYINSFGDGADLDFVHLTCLARLRASARGFSRPDDSILSRIEEYRSDDGGYHHMTKHASRGSVYAAFLAISVYEEFGVDIPRIDRLRAGLDGLKTGCGAYMNEADALCSGTNATAAAVVARSRLGDEVEPATRDWLLAQHCPEGGFRANPHTPVPDLLSTATALFALRSVRTPLSDLWRPTTDFVESLWHTDGGFRGHPADPVPDCEYTFYALLALGCFT
ncbi:MAG: hypothetical protein J7M12_06595 [Candidatus Hydrogenedentes bacterium]|nr:hypothetical protein [Candidatus Hydrogenedentota bacterium]